MKNLLLITFLLPAAAMAQSQADYESMMNKFVKHYNKGNSEQIVAMFPKDAQKFILSAYKPEEFVSKHEEQGKIQSFRYLGIDTTDPEQVRVFRVETTKGVRTMSFNLGPDGLFGTFRQYTTSDYIEQMLRNSR